MKFLCTCKKETSSNNKHCVQREVEVDKEDKCLDCGHYAFAVGRDKTHLFKSQEELDSEWDF